MSYGKRAARRDEAEPAIVEALRAAGASVKIVGEGDGEPDLMVGFRGATYHLEVKNPLGPRGGASGGGASRPGQGGDGVLTRAQIEWWLSWRGARPAIVRTPAEALAAIGVESASRPDPAEAPALADTSQRIAPADCRDQTAHAIQPDTDSCRCGESIVDFGAAVTLRCTGCDLEYQGKMGYSDGLMAPIHWTGDELARPRPLCSGVGKDGLPAIRAVAPPPAQAKPPRQGRKARR